MVANQLLFPIPSYPVLLVNISQKITIISPFLCIIPQTQLLRVVKWDDPPSYVCWCITQLLPISTYPSVRSSSIPVNLVKY